jgi:hypothetical protein
MNCDEVRPLLGDLLDSELSVEDQARLESHLGQCAGCKAEYEAERSLLVAAGELDDEIAPARDLWEGIEARVATSGGQIVRGPWYSSSWLGWAAAAVLIVVLGVQMNNERTAETAVDSRASLPDRGAIELSRVELAAQVSDAVRSRNGLMQVREDLLRSIIERRDSLDPEARRLVDENRLVIDQAITDIFHALQENPENRGLEFLLASTYQHEVSFLKQMNLL